VPVESPARSVRPVSLARAARRRLIPVAAGVAVCGFATVAVTACGPSHPGAAAIVGDTRISISDLQAAVARTEADPAALSVVSPNGDVSALQRSVLSHLIEYALVDQTAKQKGVAATPGDISTLLASATKSLGGQSQLNAQLEQDGIAVADTNQFVTNLVLEQKLETALTKNGTINEVHAAHILVATKALADKILAEVKADPSKFAALAKQYSTDTNSAASGGDLGTEPQGSFVQPFDDEVNTQPVGSYFEVHTQYGYHVVHVISRATVKLSSLDPSSTASQTALGAALNASLTSVAKQEGVTVNPRYGTWDTSTNTINGASDALSSPEAGIASSPAASPAS
jgi:parvulin-like peptidyl-prolyl isomerase